MGVTQRTNNMSVSILHAAIASLLLVCIPSVVYAAGGGNLDPPGGSALDPDQTEFIKTEIEQLSNMTKEGLQPSGADLHQLLSLRLNIETPVDEGRDGLSDFPAVQPLSFRQTGKSR